MSHLFRTTTREYVSKAKPKMSDEIKEKLPPIFYVGFLTGIAMQFRENGDERRAKRLDEASAALRDCIHALGLKDETT
jgi:hypothetical protein